MNQLKLIELHRFPPLCISVHIYIFIYFFIFLWPKNKKNSFITETGLIRIAHQFFGCGKSASPETPAAHMPPFLYWSRGLPTEYPDEDEDEDEVEDGCGGGKRKLRERSVRTLRRLLKCLQTERCNQAISLTPP